MAKYLRDEYLANLTLTEDRLGQLDTVISSRRFTIPEQEQAENTNNTDSPVFLFYIIRFDGKGYRVFSFNELIAYFRQSDSVERIIFTIESTSSLRSGRNVGSFCELRLDKSESSNSFMQVSSDDGDWVESTFSSIKDVLQKCRNKNGWIRGWWSQFAIQISGVFVGFLISLWAAFSVSSFVSIDNGFLIVFLFVLLLFSNLWGFLNQRILALVNSAFPNVRFYRPDRDKLHWILQALVGGLFVAVVLFLLNGLFGIAGRILGKFVSSGA